MQSRRWPRHYATEIYALPADKRESAYQDVPAEFLNLVRYYVEVYFPPLEEFRHRVERRRAAREARERVR